GQVAHVAHDAGQLAVAQRDAMVHAALAAELEEQRRALHSDLARAQRGKAKGIVGARVFLVAHANARGLEQPHDRGEHLVAGQTGQRQVLVDAATDARQRLGEGEHATVLGLVAYFAPAHVIAVLLAPARVAAGSLEVAIVARADPDLFPGGRNRQLADACKSFRVAYRP